MPPRVVWITALPPDHQGSGGQQRQAFLLDTVAAAVRTDLVTAGEVTDPRVRAAVRSITEVAIPRPDPLDSWMRRKVALITHQLAGRHPWDVARAAPARRRLRRRLPEQLAADDIVVVEHLDLAPIVTHLWDAGRRVLTIHHDHARQAAHQEAIATTRRNRRWWRGQERRASRLQRWAVDAFDVVVAVSDADAASLGDQAVVVPNGVDLASIVPTALPREPHAVVVGTLDYGPNVDGVTWLAEAVWPRVRTEVPDARLAVVGLRPGTSIRTLHGHAGISVHPDVPDVRPYLAAARAALVPLRVGGGTRVKALEAMAAGRPLVGTSIGLEGLALEDGRTALVADDAVDLASAICRVLTDDALAQRLATTGRTHVERFGWEEISRRFLTEVLKR